MIIGVVLVLAVLVVLFLRVRPRPAGRRRHQDINADVKIDTPGQDQLGGDSASAVEVAQPALARPFVDQRVGGASSPALPAARSA